MFALSDDLIEIVQAQVATGAFRDEEAVVRAALDALSQRQTEGIKSIERGLKQAAEGKRRPVRESNREFRERHGLSRSE